MLRKDRVTSQKTQKRLPMQLVRAGRAADVLEYIDAVDAGVFA